MKKNIYKLLATAFAVAFIVASPATTITSHALGFNPGARDDTDYGYRPDDYGQNWSNNGGSTESGQPAPSGDSNNNGSGNNGSSNSGSSNSGETSDGYWSKQDPDDVVVNVPGVQKFRSVMNKDHTVYEVYHCGISRASFRVTDAKGNVVTFSTVTLEKGEDGLWYLNITLPADVDVKGLTVSLIKGDLAYLASELGVSGIQLNGTVMLLTTTAEEEEAPATGAEKSDKKETETPKTGSESTAVGARVCWCGYRIDIANKGGLSAEEKAAWKAHAAVHLAKGESTSYTDIAY